MRLLKPGKVASSATERTRVAPRVLSAKVTEREIWDDYAVNKKGKKKKEYELGTGNRMIPRPLEGKERPEGEAGSEELARREAEGGPRYVPRTDFEALETSFRYQFKDRSLLQRALTHRSALGIAERADYERLEFLGDAVLDLSVAHLLSDRHPEAREGELSKMRAALVNTQALAAIGKVLDLGPYIRLGRGEFSSGGADRPSILADVMEAVIGAIYRDSNYDNALAIIEAIFGEYLDKVTPYDPKTELQEALHAAGSEPPSYLLEMVEGPEHAPTFVTLVVVDGMIAGRGRGTTKKAAQQSSAAEALRSMMSDPHPLLLVEGQRIIIADLLLVSSGELPQPLQPPVDAILVEREAPELESVV